MPTEVQVPVSLVLAFWLVLARVAAIVALLPLPGLEGAGLMSKILLTLVLTIALFPAWPVIEPAGITLWSLAGFALAEAVLGIILGLAVLFFTEALMMGFQVVGLQAGYSYAAMVDPATQADSGILIILGRLAAVLLFFSFGLERVLIAGLAQSLRSLPPGHWYPLSGSIEPVIQLGSSMLELAVRIALPAVALLALIDLSIALLGRLNQQLQLMSLIFPAKMLAGLVMLALTLPFVLGPLQQFADHTARYIFRVVTGP